MQMIWKIDKKFETRQRKNKQTNKKQQQKRQEKKIHHRIHKDKVNTMIYKKISLTLKTEKNEEGAPNL